MKQSKKEGIFETLGEIFGNTNKEEFVADVNRLLENVSKVQSIDSRNVLPTKVTIEHHEMKLSAEFPNSNINLTQLFYLFKQVILGVGFQNESWEKVIVELANEINEK